MANAISNREQLGYSMEATWGTTPASALQLVRFTKITSGHPIDLFQSAEVVNTSEVAANVRVGARANLSFDCEMSYGNLDDFLQSIFAAAWQTGVPGVGSDTLQPGVVRKSMTVERQFLDIGRYLTYKGGQVNQVTLNVAVKKALTATVQVMSKYPTSAATTGGTGAATAVNANAIMDPISSIQLVQEGGAGSVVGLTEAQITIKRNVIDFPQVTSVDPLDLQPGLFTVEGSFSCYFQDATYLAKVLAFTNDSFALTIGGVSNKRYALTIGTMNFTDFSADDQGLDQPFVQKLPWKASKDATLQTLKVVRTA